MLQVLELLPYVSLAFGLLFFTYALRYYLALAYTAYILFRGRKYNNYGKNDFQTNGGLKLRNYANGGTSSYPFFNGNHFPMVSIHIPLYNEERVAARLMEALLSLEYPRYEVIVVDDSTDSTPVILKRYEKDPRVKIIHRQNRSGFKGGALREALKIMSDEAEYVVVFDADFIPPKDIIQRLLSEFSNAYSNAKFDEKKNGKNLRKILDELYNSREIVAVQGYQWHVLNASENWITKAVSAEYAGNYLVERLFVNSLMLGVRMISGSVFMIRADILRQYGWRDSLTEDWDLTLRLYRDGYKVRYTQLAAAPAECPATLTSLIRQRARWAEGHTFAVKRYFMEILRSKFLSLREKLEFLYLSPYYLSSLFLILGTALWLTAELLRVKIPFWTSTFGWSLLITNMMAIPLVNLTGLWLEYRASKHWHGAFTFIPLMHVLAIFQAVAALKGLFGKKESAWFRTLKTGKITEGIFAYITRILKGRRPTKKRSGIVSCAILSLLSSFLAYALIKLLMKSAEESGRIPQPAEYAILMASISVGITTLVWLMSRGTRIGGMMPKLLISIAVMASSYVLLRLLFGAESFTFYEFASAMTSACLGMCLFYSSRFSPNAFALKKAGILFVMVSFMLLLTFQTVQHTQAYVPQETLYLHPNGTHIPPSQGYGEMSNRLPEGFQILWRRTFYWRSTSAYDFTPHDRGTWVFHFAGKNSPNQLELRVGVRVYVSNDPESPPSKLIKIGEAFFTITEIDEFDIDVPIEVNPPECTGCYIFLSLTPFGRVEMYTGYMKKYTYLVIPENFLAFMPFALLLLLARRAFRKPRQLVHH